MKGRDGLFRRGRGPFSFRWKDDNGRWRERSTGCRDRQEARAAKREFEEDVEAGQVPTDFAKMTVAQAVERWLKSRKGLLDPNTIRSYSTNFTAPAAFFKDRRLSSITHTDIREYQGSRRLAGKADRTINHETDALAYLLVEANCWKKLSDHYTRFKTPRHSTRKPLTNEQFNRLVTTALGVAEWEVALYAALAAAQTSCRPCEIAGLQLERIHLDGPRPYIEINRKTTKTNAGPREIDLNRYAELAIRRLLARAHKLGACAPHHYLLPRDLSRHTKAADPLYSRRFGGFDPNLHQRSWDTAWCKLRIAAGLPDVLFYQLRNTALSAFAEEKTPLMTVKGLAGHMNEAMSEWYIEASERAKVKAVKAIERANPELADILGLPREELVAADTDERRTAYRDVTQTEQSTRHII